MKEDKEVELPDSSLTKVAIEICNTPELKKEVLCLPGSDYEMEERNLKAGRMSLYSFIDRRRKGLWNGIVEKKATIILEEKYNIAEKLQEKVKGNVLLVGMRMLTWAVYHERTFGLSRRYCFDFLSSSFFTEQGIIDSTKAAEELVNDKNLTVEQRYKLACLHCFKERIPALYMKMAKRKFYDPEEPEKIEQPELVKFWSYYQMGEIDVLKGEKTLDQYRLEKAVESGSKSAVEFCLEKTNLRRKRCAIVDAATLAVKCKVRAGTECTGKDWVVFRDQSYFEEPWTPSHYYVDIAFFLLSKMPGDLRIEFLKQDIVGAKYEREISGDYRIPKVQYSRVLDYFLNWPYPCFFMETARLLWEYLPEKHFAVLLRRICSKIESEEELLMYGEGKSYDYRGLLREFWCQSPERFKRYVFSNQKVSLIPDTKVCTETGAGLLVNLLTLQNFTYEDGENTKLILASATCKEKENIFSSTEWRETCIVQMRDENWEILNRFVLNCFSSKEEEDKFKREFCFTKEALSTCIGFVMYDDLDEAESFIKWSCSQEEETNKLKKEMIYSEDGMRACLDAFSCEEEVQGLDRFIRWSLPSEEEVEAFKKKLIYSDHGYYKCQSLVRESQLELASEFIHFCLPSEGEARELFKVIAYKFGNLICETLITDSEEEEWKRIDQFLRWCFSSEEEVNEFKRKVILNEAGCATHFNLIKSNKRERAERFFAWLGLSAEEIKNLKKEMIYSEDGMRACIDAFSCEEEVQALDQFIRWSLPSEEVEAFKKKLIHSDHWFYKCHSLVGASQLELASEFIHFCLPSEGEARELFKVIAYKFGDLICETLVADSEEEEWERIDQFLRWCFSSEEEVNEFKRKVILNEAGCATHFNLIKSNKLETAERFFAWLGLSAEEIKNLKKETLFSHKAALSMLIDLAESDEGDERFVNYGSKQEAIQLFMKWYLTDREAVLDFKDKITNGISDVTKEKRCAYETLLLTLEELLSGLDDEI